MMDKPKNVAELIAYLKKNPRVTYTNVINNVYNQKRIFNRISVDGIKWVIDGDIQNFAFTPIYCNIANIKLSFSEYGFTVTAFDVTGRFYYED